MRKVADHFELPANEAVKEQPPAGTVRGRVEAIAGTTAQIVPAPAGPARPALSHVGRYQLRTLITQGNSGAVYEAWDPLLSRAVAIKTLQFGLGMTARIAVDRRLLQAIREASSLVHRGIPEILDAGLCAHGVYVCTELLSGRDLRRALADGWQPTSAEVLKLVRRAAEAVAYAHEQGILHGDIKPSSLFITRSGRPRLLNLGVARVLADPAVGELDGLRLGWPQYQAPEQIERRGFDARSDVYALGLVLYELLAGRKAFAGDSLATLRQAILTGARTPLGELRPELPAGLLKTVDAALSLDPRQRPATARVLVEALRQAAAEVAALEVEDSPIRLGFAALASFTRRPVRQWRWPL